MKIDSFLGKYFFLSNFYNKAPFEYNGMRFQNSEAAFQAAKSSSYSERTAFTTLDPREAKKRGREIELRKDWEDVKVQIMEDVIRAKFAQNKPLRVRLIETGDAELVEGNSWGDTFWGADAVTGKGENHLGKILMKIRDECRLTNLERIRALPASELAEILVKEIEVNEGDEGCDGEWYDYYVTSYEAPDGQQFYTFEDAVEHTAYWLSRKVIDTQHEQC